MDKVIKYRGKTYNSSQISELIEIITKNRNGFLSIYILVLDTIIIGMRAYETTPIV